MHCFRHSSKFSTPTAGVRRYISVKSSPHYDDRDVVIVGGGPAGLALASALMSSPAIRESLQITLVEASDLSKVRDWAPHLGTFSNRVSSLTNTSQLFLKDIGAWSHVQIERTCPMDEIQVWDGISDARITFSASELGLDDRAAVITENLNLQRGLLRHLSSISEVELLDKTQVGSIQREERGEGEGWPLVHLSDGRIFRTRLLVGADGFNSPVRSYAGISSYGWSYDTQAIVATLSHPPRNFPNLVAYQRFLPTGPIAFLPLSPTTSSLVWSTKPRLASALTSSDPAVLISMINAAFRLPEFSMRYLHQIILDTQQAGTPTTHAQIQDEIIWRERSHGVDQNSKYAPASPDVLGVGISPADSDSLPPVVRSIQFGTIASFPIRFNHVDSYIGAGPGSRTVLIGDAAHTIHPLAGQGLNMGLGDVHSLVRCIHNAVLQGDDIGSHTALLPYAQDRYFENHKLMSAVDKLHKLYSSTFQPLVWARSVGLEVLNELDSVKAAIMTTAGASLSVNTDVSASLGWNLAVRGVEGIARSISAAGEALTGPRKVYTPPDRHN